MATTGASPTLLSRPNSESSWPKVFRLATAKDSLWPASKNFFAIIITLRGKKPKTKTKHDSLEHFLPHDLTSFKLKCMLDKEFNGVMCSAHANPTEMVLRSRDKLVSIVNEACANVVCFHPPPDSMTTRVSGTGEYRG